MPVALDRRLAYPEHMFRRLLLLWLIALLPLQGVAASFFSACPAMADGQTMQGGAMSGDDMSLARSDMPCHEHGDEGGVAGSPLDQGCCHHLAVAIPHAFAVPAAALAPGQVYPAIADSFTDHLPDRLQRPPLSLVI
jgi:hypothetical protein